MTRHVVDSPAQAHTYGETGILDKGSIPLITSCRDLFRGICNCDKDQFIMDQKGFYIDNYNNTLILISRFSAMPENSMLFLSEKQDGIGMKIVPLLCSHTIMCICG